MCGVDVEASRYGAMELWSRAASVSAWRYGDWRHPAGMQAWKYGGVELCSLEARRRRVDAEAWRYGAWALEGLLV